MKYRGKVIEIVGENEVTGKAITWARVLGDGSFHEVAKENLNPNDGTPLN